MSKLDYPFDYTDLEPAAQEVAKDDAQRATADSQQEAFAYSSAISLKRIADALDRLSPVRGPRWPNLLTPEEIARQGE
jgi:hypothetical protein